MNPTRALVPLCVTLPSLLACGEAAVAPAKSADAQRGGPTPATVVSVPEASAESLDTEQGAREDEEAPANSAAAHLAGYAGWFRGELMSTGEMVPAITHLRLKDGALTGDYTFGAALDERGTLHDCSEPEPDRVRCEWRDEYGSGVLELRFGSDTSYFEGVWSDETQPELSHPWTGVRMGEAE